MAIPKVSVIIPVYNTEQYLEAAISSIQNQTLKDIEILVINDGSTDSSGTIAEHLAESDSRIKCYVQENKGLSLTRNFGIEQACGDYIYFMDSDDLLEEDALEKCYELCVSKDLDLVVFDALIFSDDGESTDWGLNYDRRDEIVEGIYGGKEILKILLSKDLFKAPAWLYFIRHSFLMKIELRFYPSIIHEDELFTPILYMEADKVGYIAAHFFHRRMRLNSIMTRKFSSKNVEGYIIVVEQLRLYSKGKDSATDNLVRVLIETIVNSLSYRAHVLTFDQRIALFKSFYRKDFMKYILFKNLFILIFPLTITIKSKILRPFLKKIYIDY